MIETWEKNIRDFIKISDKHNVRMIMVGGGAVNFHGYQRHSLDVDFWLESVTENFNKLVTVFREFVYEIEDLPEEVKKLQQNISLNSKRNGLEWCVLSFEDLITRKIKAARPKICRTYKNFNASKII